MAKGIFSNVSVQKLIQRGFKPRTGGFIREGVTEYSKIMPKTGTYVNYQMAGDKVLSKAVFPGPGTYAYRVNNIQSIKVDNRRMRACMGDESSLPVIVFGDASTVKTAIQYNAQLRKEGYDLSTRMNALDLTFA